MSGGFPDFFIYFMAMKNNKDNKKEIILINPPWYRFFGQEWSVKPLGLCYIAAVLEKHGFDVGIYNADSCPGLQMTDAYSTTQNFQKYLLRMTNQEDLIWREVEVLITDFLPQIVGISMNTVQYKSALTLAKLIKKIDSKIIVVGGGVHPTVCPDEILNGGYFDYLVRGEGEYTMLELAKALRRDKPVDCINGISYKHDNKIIHNPARELIENLDDLPWPANHLILNIKDMMPDDFAYVMASRGCPYQCIFCVAHKIWSRKVRFRSPRNVVDEIKLIKQNYSPVYFHFQDDSFTLDSKFIDELCNLLIKEKINIRWVCETRVDLADDQMLKTMRQAGCFKVILGVESGSPLTLSKIKKHISLEQVRKAVRLCKKNKLETSIFFLIGFPWETEKEIKETVALMEELDPQYAVFSVATPYPGTELYDICKNENLLPPNPDWSRFFHQSPDMFLTKNLSKIQTKKIIKDVENKFVRHNKKKHRIKLLNPFRLFLELKRFYKQPRVLVSKIRYILKIDRYKNE